METSNLPNKELKVIITKMLKELRRSSEDQSKKLDVFNKKLQNIRKKQTELKNTMTEIKKYIEGINIRLDDTKQQISELEDRVVEITQAEEDKEFFKNEDSLGFPQQSSG